MSGNARERNERMITEADCATIPVTAEDCRTTDHLEQVPGENLVATCQGLQCSGPWQGSDARMRNRAWTFMHGTKATYHWKDMDWSLNPYATIGLSCVEIRFLRRLTVVTQFLKCRSFNAVESRVETLMRRYTNNPMEKE